MKFPIPLPVTLSDAVAPPGGPPRSGDAGAAQAQAGLVLSKTSPNSEFLINLDHGSCLLRRIKRMRKGLWAAASQLCLPRPGFRPDISWFITLTFAEADAWEPKHLSRATDRFNRWCKSIGVECRYAWVAEIQGKRAERTGDHVVHYHLLAWLPHGVTMPKWDVTCGRRKAFWPHGMTNTQIAKAGVGYLMKYVSKMGEFSDFPKGLRLSGKGGLNGTSRSVCAWINLPEWVKRTFGVGDVIRKSGRLVVHATGEVLKSPYLVFLVPGAIIVHTIGVIPERFHCGPYSTLQTIEEVA